MSDLFANTMGAAGGSGESVTALEEGASGAASGGVEGLSAVSERVHYILCTQTSVYTL